MRYEMKMRGCGGGGGGEVPFLKKPIRQLKGPR